MTMKVLMYVVLLGFCVVWSNDFTLPNEHIIKNIVPKKMIVAGEPALVIQYETDYSINNLDSLRLEAESLLPFMYPDIMKSGYNLAYLQASEPKRGGIISMRNNFSFKLRKDSVDNLRFSKQSWGQDYTEKADIKAKKFVQYWLNGNYNEMASMYYLSDTLDQKQRQTEIKELTASLGRVLNGEKIIEINNSKAVINKKTTALTSMDRYWWQKRPPVYYCGFTIKTEKKTYPASIAFSLINSELQIGMMLINQEGP